MTLLGSLARRSRDALLHRHDVCMFVATIDHELTPPPSGAEVSFAPLDVPPPVMAADSEDDAHAVGDFTDHVHGAPGMERLPRGIIVRGELAGWGFVTRVTVPFPVGEAPGAHVPADPGDAVLTAYYVRERHRGAGRYQQLLAQMAREAFASGATRVWVYAVASNEPSCRAILRVGFAPAGQWHCQRTLGVLDVRWQPPLSRPG